MRNPEIRPATSDLLTKFYGELPRTQKSLVIIEDGELIAVTGLYPDKDRMIMFTDIKEEIRPRLKDYRRTILICAKRLFKMTNNLPVHALADPEIEGSDRMLKHFGFEQLQKDLYSWHS